MHFYEDFPVLLALICAFIATSDEICADISKPEKPKLESRTQTELKFTFKSVLPDLEDLVYKLIKEDGQDWVICDKISTTCVADNLSPGARYYYHLTVCSQALDCCTKSDKCLETTYPEVPNAAFTPLNSTTIHATIIPSNKTMGITAYSIGLNTSELCEMRWANELKECMFTGLSPATCYGFVVWSWISRSDKLGYSREVISCTTPPTPSEPTCDGRASDNIAWKFSPIRDSNNSFSYKIVDQNLKHLASCNSSDWVCNASGLSPGTVYTGYLVVCFVDPNSKEVCSERSIGVRCTTSPSPPSVVTVEPASSSSVKVVIAIPEITTGIGRYTARIGGSVSIPCNDKEDEKIRTCVVSGLSPSTQHIVSAQSWLSGEFSSVSSIAAQGSGWTKPSSPESFHIKPLSSTSLQVTIKPLGISSNTERHEVFLKQDEQIICSNDGLSFYECILNDLRACTQYHLTAQACFNTSERVICSDPVGNSAWTKPSKCSSELTVDKSSGESIKVSFEKNIEDTEGKKLTYFVQTINSESATEFTLKCETSRAKVSCDIRGLQGCTGYNITAVACPPDSEKVTESCSEPSDQLLAKTVPMAPVDLKVEHVSATSMKLLWLAPMKNSAVEMYEVTIASVDGTNVEDKKNCSTTNYQIDGLEGNTLYSLSVRSWCPAYGTTPETNSDSSPPLQQLTKVDVPTSLKAISVGEDFIIVEWMNPAQNISDLKSCVDYMDVDAFNATNDRIDAPVQVGLQSLNVSQLNSNTEYAVGVCLCKSEKIENCVCANPGIKAITLPRVPKLLSFVSSKSNSLEVSWSAVDQRPKDLFYEVNAFDIFDIDKPKDSCSVSATTNSTNCEMTNLNANTKYNVFITAHRAGGLRSSNPGDILYARTRLEHLPSVKASKVTTYSITVTWQEVPNSQIALEYLNITANSGGSTKYCHLHPPLGNKCIFDNLEGGTEYSISGFVCAPLEVPYPAGCSDGFETFTILTLPSPRSNCNVAEVTTDKVTVKCLSVEKRSAKNEVVESIVMARADENSSSYDCSIASNSNGCSINGLTPDTCYSISLKSCFADRICGDEVLIINISTANSLNLTLLVSLVVVCVIVVVLLVLLVVFGMQIKTLRHQKTVSTISANLKDFIIDYFEPMEPYAGANQLYLPIPFENFKDHVKSLESQNEIGTIFKNLDSLAKEQEENFRLSCNVAKRFPLQNRYCNILPYDQSLVILGQKWPISLQSTATRVIKGSLSAAYVNASFVRRPQYEVTGCAVVAAYTQSPDYIAAQGPLENTVADFLTMVYEQRVPHLIMLCRNEEDKKTKCARYWPKDSKVGAAETFTSGQHTVTVVSVNFEPFESGVRRVFTVRPTDEKDPWTVMQIQISNWDDFRCPEMDSFYELLQMHNDLNDKYPIGDFGPPLVHCSAGVGRSGTLICGRFLLDRLHEDPSMIDVLGTVLAVRKWRKFLVQAEVQLKFLYDFVIYVIEREGLKLLTNLPLGLALNDEAFHCSAEK